MTEETEVETVEEEVVEELEEEIVEDVIEEAGDVEAEEVVAEEEEVEPEESDEVTVVIEGEEPEEKEEAAPTWVKDLRKKNREDQKRIKELEAKLEATNAPKKTVLGEKPTLEGCDFDADKFESELESWGNRKRAIEAETTKAQQEKENQQTEWNEKLSAYQEKKTELKVSDYDDAETVAQEYLDVTQQGIIVQGADNPALVIYALGNNEKKAKELAAIKDPVKFTFAIAKLEDKLKITGKKVPPKPEKKVIGTAKVSGAVDSALDQLRADAEKSGDYSKVQAYKRNKRSA